jgi:prepilin peptidase CpaA
LFLTPFLAGHFGPTGGPRQAADFDPRQRELNRMPDLPVFPAAVTLAAACLATGTDLRGFRIPNSLTLPLLATGWVYHGFAGRGAILDSLLGSLLGGAVLFLVYLLGGMGAGDVKLLAGVGAWLGVDWTLCVFIIAGLAGGIYALLLLSLTPRRAATPPIEQAVQRPDRRRRLVPFAAMILVGLCVAVVWSFARRGMP